MTSILTYYPYLGFKHDAGHGHYSVLHMPYKGDNVPGSSPAGVYKKSRVLFAHLRAADGITLETGLVYHGGSITAHSSGGLCFTIRLPALKEDQI